MSASAILRLQKVGFSAEQVEALADLVDSQAASKVDLERAVHQLDSRLSETRTELKGEIADFKAEVRGEIADFKTEVRGEIGELRTEMRRENAVLRLDLSSLEIRLVRWLIGVGAATVLAIAGLLRLMVH